MVVMGDTMMSPTGAVTARRVLLGLSASIITLVFGLFLSPYLLPGSVEKSLVRSVLAAAINRPVQISGETSLTILPSVRLAAQNIVISDDRDSDQPELADIASLRLELDTAALFSNFLTIKQLLIDRPIVRLHRNMDGKPNWQWSLEASNAPVLSEPDFDWGWWRGLELEDIQIRDGRLTYDDRSSGRRIVGKNANFTAKMSNVTGAEDGLSLHGDIDINDEAVTVRLDTGSLQRLMTGGRLPIDLEVSSRTANVRYQGAMAKRQHLVTQGRVSVDVPNIARMERWIGQFFSEPIIGGLKWTSNISLNADRTVLKDMKLVMDDGEYFGSLVFDDGRNGVILDGDIVATRLDASPLKSLLADKRWLGGIAGTLRLKWGQLVFGGTQFGKGYLTAQFQPLRRRVILTLNELSAYGGTARGTAKISNREGMTSLDVNLEMSRVNAGPLLKGWYASPVLTGRSDFKLGLFSVGSSRSELLAALRGVGEFNVVQGAVFNPGLTKLADEEDLQTLDFSQLIGSFSIDQGIVRGRDLLLKAGQMSLIGDGEIDLSRNHVDFHMQSLLRSQKEGDDGALTVQPFRIRGDLTNVEVLADQS
jgi:AsmA protein